MQRLQNPKKNWYYWDGPETSPPSEAQELIKCYILMQQTHRKTLFGALALVPCLMF